MFDPQKALDKINEQNRIISEGSKEELVEYAKSYDIHQESISQHYNDICNKIKAKLEYYGVDPESVR